ncbi:MAG: REP-associated tyrosine transposase [Verrucomicrobiota bacterium]|jgi:REP element-mobilizing transposase RayT
MPERPPRLERIFACYDPPLYFVTFNTSHRWKLLANARVHNRFMTFSKIGETRNIAVGRYVLMPDHVHLFVQGSLDFILTQWVRLLKRDLSNVIPIDRPHWQKGFFDHLIRNSESYAQKWEYVRKNPVRAGLAVTAEAWPYQGELVRLEAR